MKVEGHKVTLKLEEVCEECPAKPKCAASMIKQYGVQTRPEGRLGKFSRCPEVLKEAGYKVVIEK